MSEQDEAHANLECKLAYYTPLMRASGNPTIAALLMRALEELNERRYRIQELEQRALANIPT